ncbi:MAG TPA: TIGR00153 family protein, partial [Candidatus Latescibacteria bacterium]|nr:TIGR00153 family protein [Candidatus Latescibacterota bacterium]
LEKEVSREEHRIDVRKREIRENLPKGVFLPVDRSDLLAFLKPQDSIADFVEDVVHIMSLRPGKVPEEIRKGLSELVDAVRTVDAYVETVGKLSRVARFSFRGKDIAQVMEEISRVEELEHETDIIEMSLGRTIFAAEGEIGPVGVYHLSELAKAIGEVADNAARAADRLRTMICRR